MKNKEYYLSLDKRTKEYKQWDALQKLEVKEPITITHGGLGDIVEKFTEATGIKKIVDIFVDGKDCGCDKRKKKLNEVLPQKFKARCFTEQEYNTWKHFREVRTLRIERPQIVYISKLYASVFNRGYYEPCSGCSPKPLISMIDKLDKVFEVYEKDLRKTMIERLNQLKQNNEN